MGDSRLRSEGRQLPSSRGGRTETRGDIYLRVCASGPEQRQASRKR